jgi:hypothetical protein
LASGRLPAQQGPPQSRPTGATPRIVKAKQRAPGRERQPESANQRAPTRERQAESARQRAPGVDCPTGATPRIGGRRGANRGHPLSWQPKAASNVWLVGERLASGRLPAQQGPPQSRPTGATPRIVKAKQRAPGRERQPESAKQRAPGRERQGSTAQLVPPPESEADEGRIGATP